MSIAPPIKDLLSRLIDTFPAAQDEKAIERKLIAILRDHYQTNSDAETLEHLEGLEEKCRVLKNDELGDALAQRYEKLRECQSRWKFDVLSLLLQLQDDPINKTCLEDLEELIPAPLPQNLTWNELLQDDPFEDEEIWQTINYAESSSAASEWSAQSSDRDGAREEDSVIDSIEVDELNSLFLDPSSNEELEGIIAARDRSLDNSDTFKLTETQLIRETLFMLQSLPSTIYPRESGRISTTNSISVGDITPDVLNELLKPLCDIGNLLSHIRSNLAKKQQGTVLQSFQASLLRLLEDFDIHLSTFEQKIIGREGSSSTLLSVADAVVTAFRPLRLLGPLLDQMSSDASFSILDALFDLVVQQQSFSNPVLFRTTGEIFFRCLNTYLRPVKDWIVNGSLANHSEDFFMVEDGNRSGALNIWQNQFKLNLNDNGLVRGPQFLHPILIKAFIAGKGTNLLSRIAPAHSPIRNVESVMLDLESVCGNSVSTFRPFEDSLASALQSWIISTSHVSDKQVLAAVKEEGKLEETLSALQYLYFFSNGASSQQMAYSIFERIDSGIHWLDGFLLTDLIQESLSDISALDVQRISVRVSKDQGSMSSKRSVEGLEMMKVYYHLPWCAAAVIQSKHISILQEVFVLLLQVKRASQLLKDCTFDLFLHFSAIQKAMLFGLRHQLLWFCDTVYSYVTIGVFEATMKNLRDCSQNADNLDELVNAFDSTITSLLECCILAEHQLTAHKAMISVLDIVVLFSNLCSDTSAGMRTASPHQKGRRQGPGEGHEPRTDSKLFRESSKYEDTLRKYSQDFDQLLSFTIASIQESSRKSKQTLLQVFLDNLRLGLSSS